MRDAQIDISGYGTCAGGRILVESAAAWTQYPAAPRLLRDPPLEALQAFRGRNSLVGADGHGLDLFRVEGVRRRDDGRVEIETDRPLHVHGRCHFTLDAYSILGACPPGNPKCCAWYGSTDECYAPCPDDDAAKCTCPAGERAVVGGRLVCPKKP